MKLSVIVSVYNTEAYLRRCLDSLVNQTYKDMEIIVVNDGSKDNSKNIIKEYAKKYKNIVFIDNLKNMGLAYSRNIGLDNSKGDYIGYIDSDDYIDLNYYELFMKNIKKDKSDLAICDIKLVYEDNLNQTQISKCFKEKMDRLNIINNGLAASACNKVFKRSLINKYKFEVGRVNEDLAVVLPSIINAHKITYVQNTYYYYVQHNNSIQNSRFSDKRFDIFYGVDLTLKRIKGCKNYNKIKDAIVFEQIISLLIYVIPKEKNIIKRRNILKKYNKLSKKYKIRLNTYFWHFLESVGKKHKYYYKLVFKLNCSGLYMLTSILIFVYDLFKKLFRRSLVKLDVNVLDLEKEAIKNSKLKEKLKISVVVPNYNYSNFLYQRIYSILNQKVKISEIIILDDNSTDDSIAKIDEIGSRLSKYISIKKIYNNENSGSAFIQWEKGFNTSSSDYVWIAEADDYCLNTMLKNLIKPILKNKNIIISYCDTMFIDTFGKMMLKSIKSEIDILKTGHWNKSYINDGKTEFNNYTYLNCTIANVSSCLIKKDDYLKYFKLSNKYKQCGDWLFYANIMQLGDIAYTNKTLNCYRTHGGNVTSVTKKEEHFKEILKIHEYFDKTYKLNNKQKKEIKKRYKFLKKVWNLNVK